MSPDDMFTGLNEHFTSFFKLMCFVVIVIFLAEVAVLFAVIYAVLKLTGAM